MLVTLCLYGADAWSGEEAPEPRGEKYVVESFRPDINILGRNVLQYLFEYALDRNELALAYGGYGRLHKQQGGIAQAREYLTKVLGILERLGTLVERDKVRGASAELP